MKVLLYNIAYGTGSPKGFYHQIVHVHNYIRTAHHHLERITDFIKEYDPDLSGIVEVDTGSYRTSYSNQVELLTKDLDVYHHYSNKYGRRSISKHFPILNKQANAILSKHKAQRENHFYFPIGQKRLILNLSFEDYDFYLIHLALQRRVRKKQLEYLEVILPRRKPIIIAGDFNTFMGEAEVEPLMKEFNLMNPGKDATYPAWAPEKQLDYILCSKDFTLNDYKVPHIKYSDHLPVCADIYL